jgi:hypothetical protein
MIIRAPIGQPTQRLWELSEIELYRERAAILQSLKKLIPTFTDYPAILQKVALNINCLPDGVAFAPNSS